MGTSSPPWSSEKLSQGGAGVKSLPRHLNPPGIAAGGESAEGGRRREPQSTWLARVGGGGWWKGIIRPVPLTAPASLRGVTRGVVKLLGFAVDVAK